MSGPSPLDGQIQLVADDATVEHRRLRVLAQEVRADHEAFALELRATLDSAIRIGEKLIEAKELCRHGEWLPWLDVAGLEPRTAQRYMRVARNATNVSHLPSVGAALAELTAPKGDDDEVVDGPVTGEVVDPLDEDDEASDSFDEEEIPFEDLPAKKLPKPRKTWVEQLRRLPLGWRIRWEKRGFPPSVHEIEDGLRALDSVEAELQRELGEARARGTGR